MSDRIDNEVSRRKRNDLGMQIKKRLGLSEISEFVDIYMNMRMRYISLSSLQVSLFESPLDQRRINN
jgi:hypothetical protein